MVWISSCSKYLWQQTITDLFPSQTGLAEQCHSNRSASQWSLLPCMPPEHVQKAQYKKDIRYKSNVHCLPLAATALGATVAGRAQRGIEEVLHGQERGHLTEWAHAKLLSSALGKTSKQHLPQ